MYLKILSIITLLILAVSCGGGEYDQMDLEGKLNYLLEKSESATDEEKVDLKAKLKSVNTEITSYNATIQDLKKVLGQKEKFEAVETNLISKSNFDRYVSLQSVVESDLNAMISPKMSGVITGINVNEGDYVKKGDILIEIDNSIQLRRLAQAKNQLSFIETVYQKQKRVWDKKVGSEIEFLKAKNDYENMLENIKLIEEEISMLNVKAPFSGVVDMVSPKVGEAVAPGMGVIRLVSNSNLQIKVDFAENYLTNFHKGDKVQVYFPDADIDTLNLKISTISKSVDTKKRTVTAFISVPSNSNITPNMIAVTRFNDYSLDSAIVIPINTIQKSNTGNYVYVVDEDSNGNKIAKSKVVKTGESYQDKIVVLSGLEVGEELVTTASSNVREGKLIEVIK
ncbi:efflux RND transporter periplasmic adaptor subunit [Candidatus Kapabacteria bacterium]|nr:efflux RND transporter periplasmic adaptor subunit [Candidatus Kapabacteria bacterium]